MLRYFQYWKLQDTWMSLCDLWLHTFRAWCHSGQREYSWKPFLHQTARDHLTTQSSDCGPHYYVPLNANEKHRQLNFLLLGFQRCPSCSTTVQQKGKRDIGEVKLERNSDLNWLRLKCTTFANFRNRRICERVSSTSPETLEGAHADEDSKG